MKLIPPLFVPYCVGRGIKLLEGDLKFIEKHLRKVPSELHRDVLLKYIEKFEHGLGLVDCSAPECLKQNRGRFAANVWLRTEGAP